MKFLDKASEEFNRIFKENQKIRPGDTCKVLSVVEDGGVTRVKLKRKQMISPLTVMTAFLLSPVMSYLFFSYSAWALEKSLLGIRAIWSIFNMP